MNSDNLVTLLALAAVAIAVIIVILIIAGVTKRLEDQMKAKDSEKKQVKKSEIIYTPESIIDFMDFDRIEDNMIIQKKGKFLMVVECQGINYDLMSDMEKVSVEQGFTSFLNTLRHPVQLYIQTRTINLERSIQGYKSKLKEIENKYLKIQSQYESLLKNNKSSIMDV